MSTVTEHVCVQCGEVIPPTGRPGRPRSLCSDACRLERGRELRPNGKWSHLYDIRCPACQCLCVFITSSGDPGAWGCYRCYMKFALIAPPAGLEPADYGLEAMMNG